MNRLKVGVFAVAVAFLYAMYCLAGAKSPEDEWATVQPAQAGIDSHGLEEAAAFAQSAQAGTVHGIVVVRHGALVFERYFSGQDDPFGRNPTPVAFNADTPHGAYSVTKTVTALLVGIAHDRGLLPNLDAPVIDYLPGYDDLRSEQLKRITLRHVLTMSTGFAWNEKVPFTNPENTTVAAFRSGDPYRYLLTRPFAYEPGSTWQYNSIAPGLLIAAIRKTSGKSADDFAREALFKPLGISSHEWEHLPNGDPAGGFGLSLRPRDLAKIGQVMLEKGVWKGKRIVSAAWIAEMTKPYFAIENRTYGYQNWQDQAQIGGKTVEWSAAYGFGGQRIFVVPSADLVVVITTGNYRSDPQETVPQELLTRFILPAVIGAS